MSVGEKTDFSYGLLVRTNMYTGNFERELCAYATGVVGDCGVGEKESEKFFEEAPEEYQNVSDCVGTVADDRGCYRPVSIWDSKDSPGVYQELMIFFEDLPTPEELACVCQRIRMYPEAVSSARDVVIESIRLIHRELTVVDTVLLEL